MSVLKAEIGKEGIERVFTEVTTVADGTLAAELFQVAGLGLRLTHDSIRQHFGPKLVTENAKPLPQGETDVFVCRCGETFTSADRAIKHVEGDHASARIRRDLDKLEDTIEGLILPNPLPAAPESTVIVKDRTFKDELGAELTDALGYADKDLPDLFTSKEEPHKRAQALIDYCGWGEVTGINFDEVKAKIVDKPTPGDKKIYPPMQADFLYAIASFLKQVGRLSEYGVSSYDNI